jgi:hypothetical protein
LEELLTEYEDIFAAADGIMRGKTGYITEEIRETSDQFASPR